MMIQNTTNAPENDEVTLLQQRIADLDQQIAAHAATAERLNRVEAELGVFKALLESAIDGISFATPDRVVRYANSAFGAMSGYGEQSIGQMMSDFIAPEERAAVQQEVRTSIHDTGHWQGRIPYLRPNGGVWQAQASVFLVYAPDGALIGQAIILRDATEQIRNEQGRAVRSVPTAREWITHHDTDPAPDTAQIELVDQLRGGQVAVKPLLNAGGDLRVQLPGQRIDRALAILKGKIADQRSGYQDEEHERHRQNDP